MKFRNVRVPEGINVSKHNPVVDLIMMSGGAALLFAILGLIALLIGSYAGRYMPMSWENAMAAAVFEGEDGGPADGGPADGGLAGDEFPAAEAALRKIAGRLAAGMELPEELRITAHFMDSEELNAFATLGGHIFVTRGLAARVPNENALAFVIAHEIAHAGNRDVAANLGGALLARLVLAAVTGSNAELSEGLIYGPNALILSQFSRDAERAADRDALAAVAAAYGHVAGADAFFRILLEESGPSRAEKALKFLNTHPLTDKRIEDLRALAEQRGWALEGGITPLPRTLATLGAPD